MLLKINISTKLQPPEKEGKLIFIKYDVDRKWDSET